MSQHEPWFTKFKPYRGDLNHQPVQIDEYLPAGKSVVLGMQHAFAMFGATVLAPMLMGFDPNLTILITGFGTILFFLLTGGRMPSYLGSSFAFIAAVGIQWCGCQSQYCIGTGWYSGMWSNLCCDWSDRDANRNSMD